MNILCLTAFLPWEVLIYVKQKEAPCISSWEKSQIGQTENMITWKQGLLWYHMKQVSLMGIPTATFKTTATPGIGLNKAKLK